MKQAICKEVDTSNRNRKVTLQNLSVRNGIMVCLIVSAMLTTPFLVGSNTEPDRHYSLSLSATQHFSTVVLTAILTFTEGHHEKEAVAGATIYFYLCNRFGHDLKEIGHNVTKKNGTATFSWSAPGNGDYCFIAAYAAKFPSGETVTVTS
jgi:hypothetical protein